MTSKEKRTEKINLYLSPFEKETLIQCAEMMGISVSEMIRNVLFKNPNEEEEDLQS